jgi:uncharacterized protein (TIGR02598 family)
MSERAFSLAEVTVALGIAAFCLIAIFGLLPAGLNANKAGIQQNAAANLAAMIASDLRATPATANTSAIFSIAIPTAGTTSFLTETGAATDMGTADFRAVVTISSPPAGTRTASTARILITSPAAATNATASFETVIGLDRN